MIIIYKTAPPYVRTVRLGKLYLYFVNPNSSKRANKFPVFSKGNSLSLSGTLLYNLPYELGIYYEIDLKNKEALVESYQDISKVEEKVSKF